LWLLNKPKAVRNYKSVFVTDCSPLSLPLFNLIGREQSDIETQTFLHNIKTYLQGCELEASIQEVCGVQGRYSVNIVTNLVEGGGVSKDKKFLHQPSDY
jgi:hypothetical protein